MLNSIKKMELFSGLTDTEYEKLADLCKVSTYKAGEVVFGPHLIGDSLQIIKKGTVKITFDLALAGKKGVSTFSWLSVGKYFGVFSFVDPKRHTAFAIAVEDTDILVLQKDIFDSFCHKDPVTGYLFLHKMALSLTDSVRAMDEKMGEMLSYVWGDNAYF